MIYHVFTHNHDDYTKNLQEAHDIYRKFIRDYGCARIYMKVNEDDEGDCLEAYGEWPM
jgi:hypothetical protein